MNKYIAEFAVDNVEDMWNFVSSHQVNVKYLHEIQIFKDRKWVFELITDKETACLFVLTTTPLSCVLVNK